MVPLKIWTLVIGCSCQLLLDKCLIDRLERRPPMLIMLEIVATKVVASQPPERQPTGTLTAHAKILIIYFNLTCYNQARDLGHCHLPCQQGRLTLADLKKQKITAQHFCQIS